MNLRRYAMRRNSRNQIHFELVDWLGVPFRSASSRLALASVYNQALWSRVVYALEELPEHNEPVRGYFRKMEEGQRPMPPDHGFVNSAGEPQQQAWISHKIPATTGCDHASAALRGQSAPRHTTRVCLRCVLPSRLASTRSRSVSPRNFMRNPG